MEDEKVSISLEKVSSDDCGENRVSSWSIRDVGGGSTALECSNVPFAVPFFWVWFCTGRVFGGWVVLRSETWTGRCDDDDCKV